MLRRTCRFLARARCAAGDGHGRTVARLLPLAPLALLGACSAGGPLSGLGIGAPPPPAVPGQAGVAAPGAAPASTKVGLLLPLTGGNAVLGDAMLKAAQLALAAPGSPQLDPQDTGDAPDGGGKAARAAIGNGDGVLLGPLTSGHTAEAGALARQSNIPELAFTSDIAQAQPGVWVLGLTPEQQVRRLVLAAKAAGHQQVAAFLPQNPLGDAMEAALVQVCADAGLPAPKIARHGASMEDINDSMRGLSDFAHRRGEIEQKVKDAKASDDPKVRAQADDLAKTPIPPAPFDALLLADTGTALAETITVLRYYDISSAQVQLMGPALWGSFATKLSALAGAWYAAPDQSSRAGFVGQYQAKYGQPPKPLADLAYDAAALARSLAQNGGYSSAGLTKSDGFAGVDGVFVLQPNGHVQRGLGLFQIQPGGGSRLVQPAPATAAGLGTGAGSGS